MGSRASLVTSVRPRYVVARVRCDVSCPDPSDVCMFQVAWSINPHMKVGAVKPARAVRQHAAFVDALRAAGAEVLAVPFVHGAFDSVFAKDSAVIVERPSGTREALLATPRYAERQIEQHARARALVRRGVQVSCASRAPLEGGDIVMLPRGGGAFLGHGFRSDAAAAPVLARFLGAEVTPLELVDPRLYHLDMVMHVLDDGTALVCEEALTSEARRALATHPAIREVVRVPLAEALRFGVNMVQVGRTVVLAGDARTLTPALRERGYRVRRVALDEFHHAGGSAACLVSRVHSFSAITATPRPEHDEEAPASYAA